MNKKHILSYIAAAAIMLAMSSCTQNGEVQQPTPTPTETPQATAPAVNYTEVKAENISHVPDGWSLTDKVKYDIDGDGDEETIRMYTDAQKDSDGTLMWDDGNSWILEMADASNIFTLLNERVQLGSPYFELYEDADGKPCIVVAISTGAGISAYKFEYVKDKKLFEKTEVFKEDGINKVYKSAPIYK